MEKRLIMIHQFVASTVEKKHPSAVCSVYFLVVEVNNQEFILFNE